jgi:hypothetical protein
MKTSLTALLSLFLYFQISGQVFSEEPEISETKNRVVMKKIETHKFSGLKLKGEIKKPDLSYIYQRKGLRVEQIVNIPEDFNQEIIHGAEQF